MKFLGNFIFFQQFQKVYQIRFFQSNSHPWWYLILEIFLYYQKCFIDQTVFEKLILTYLHTKNYELKVAMVFPEYLMKLYDEICNRKLITA